jgi:magnesium transporter
VGRAAYRDGMALTRLYRDGKLAAEGFPISEVSELIKDESVAVWFDLCDPDRDELRTVSEELGLHPLAVEDAEHPNQRPKLDRYPSHLFATAYSTRLEPETGELEFAEVDAFVTRNALVTVRKTDKFDVQQVLRRWDDRPDLVEHGVGYLLHGLMDYVVDTHFEAVQALDEEIESLEDLLFDDRAPDKATQRRTFELRKSLVDLRRVVLPMRETVNSLMRRDLKIVDDEMMPYFQDVYDHVLRATEWTESLRDLVSNIFETALTVRSNRLNTVTKQVTGWAAIIAVPTAITGWFGQNIDFPGKDHVGGLIASTVLILGISGSLYAIFRRKEWL